MSESRLEIDNQEYQTYLSELGRVAGSRGSRAHRVQGFQGPGVGFGPYLAAADGGGPAEAGCEKNEGYIVKKSKATSKCLFLFCILPLLVIVGRC
jgi:hypothetical protein